jgi:3-oxoacyl-[acyl-carrier protein] reductase
MERISPWTCSAICENLPHESGCGGSVNSGRIVVVTGAAGGIGAAIAEAFAALGDSLVLMDRRPITESVRHQLAERAGHDGIFCAEVDISKTAEVAACLDAARETLGAVDVLVNNAGIGPMRKFIEMSEEEWDEMMAINLKSLFNTCRAVVPPMIEKGSGTIINVASELGLVGRAGMVHYCASKGGVIAFSKALALELAPQGIHVNVVAPGPVETPLLTALSDEYTDEGLRAIPLGRWGRPEDIAATVRFLASDDASFYAGWVFSPNGGVVT